MRPLAKLSLLTLLACVLAAPAAEAGRRGSGGGGGGGGGRLGQVNEGLGDAAGGGRRGNGSPVRDHRDGRSNGDHGDHRDHRDHRGERDVVVVTAAPIVLVDGEVAVAGAVAPPPPPPSLAHVEAYVGLQQVHESDQSLSAQLAIEDRWLRIAGSVTAFWEARMEGGHQTLTVPSATLGIRLDGGRDGRGGTRAFIEGGIAGASTGGAPMGNTTLGGPMIGVHIVHALDARGRHAFIGDAHAMFFDAGVRGYAARAGVRIGPVEAAVRVLDFTVGPALYGPELGLRF